MKYKLSHSSARCATLPPSPLLGERAGVRGENAIATAKYRKVQTSKIQTGFASVGIVSTCSGRSPFRVETPPVLPPRAARSSQPRALGLNPFGILKACFRCAIFLLLAPPPVPVLAQQSEINVNKGVDPNGWPNPVPVSISGFSGEVDSVLKDDLRFMGVENVGPDKAKYLINGSNAGRVEGRVVEKINKNQILAKAYTGGTTRSQTHALADDIALAITRKPGIAQTKITFKGETGHGNGEVYIADYDGHNAQSVTHDQT